MDEILAIDIQRIFSERSALVDQAAIANEWRWPTGTHLFPRARCPYCREQMRSNRIWVINYNQLIAVYRFEGRRVVKEVSPLHPHTSGSSICLGTATGEDAASQALFGNGLNPGDEMSSHFRLFSSRQWVWFKWMRDYFDHTCLKLPHFECPYCKELKSNDERQNFLNVGIACNSCHEKLAKMCSGCYAIFLKESLVNERYCRSCAITMYGYSVCKKCSLSVKTPKRYEGNYYHEVCLPELTIASLEGVQPVDEVLNHKV